MSILMQFLLHSLYSIFYYCIWYSFFCNVYTHVFNFCCVYHLYNYNINTFHVQSISDLKTIVFFVNMQRDHYLVLPRGLSLSRLSQSSNKCCGIIESDMRIADKKSTEISGHGVDLKFKLRLTETFYVYWDMTVFGTSLHIKTQATVIENSSKQGFISLLEYAEEVLKCTNVIIHVKKDCAKKGQVIRTFMYMGFIILPPGHYLIPKSSNSNDIYMNYSLV